MGLKCKHFNKIKKKFKVVSADPGLCRRDHQKNKNKNDIFFQSCPHRPCALAHRVYEGNFATLCGNAQPCVVTHRVYAGNFFFLGPACTGQHRPWPVQAGPGKKSIFFKVASADLVRYRTRLQSCSHRPCALTHRVYEDNFASSFFDFFPPPAQASADPVRWRTWSVRATLKVFFSFFFCYFWVWLRKLRKIWVGWPKPITIVRVGSGRPRPILPRGLGQSTQNGCKVWVGLPKPVAKFGSSDPNRLQYLGRTTQTGCKLWVVPPKPAARFGWNDPNWLQGLGRAIWKFKWFLFI
jgi:hypothetical protein